jgi:hypothetical protein
MRDMRSSVLFALLIASASVASAYENSDAFVERAHRISLEYETPHTKWAKPYAFGPVRVLYVAGSQTEGMETHAREAVELAQRFDVKMDAAWRFRFYKEGWLGGVAGVKRISRLMDNPYDVFIFQDVCPTNLPSWPWEPDRKFLKKVQEGAGVVLLGAEDGGLFAGSVPLEPAPAALAGCPARKAALFGNGRIVWLSPRPVIGYHVGWEADYDRWEQQLGRAMLWAARREPVAGLDVAVSAQATARERMPLAVPVAWSNAPARAVCEARVRTADGETVDLGRQEGGRQGRMNVTIPPLRAGVHHLEVFLRGEAGISAWAVAPFAVTCETAVRRLVLAMTNALHEFPPGDTGTPASVRTGAYTPFIEPGEPIAGQVDLSGPLQGATLTVRLIDRRDRILAQQVLPAKESQSFRFAGDPALPMLVRVQVSVCRGDEELARDYRYLRVCNRKRGQYNFVLWDFPVDQTLAPYAAEVLARMGVTTILSSRTPPLAAAAYDLAWVAWTGGNVTGRDAENWGETNYNRYFTGHVSRSRPHGVLAYSLGDEGATSGTGTGPKSDAAFQRYLKEQYGDVGALNLSWGTLFTSFDEVKVAPAAPVPANPENLAPEYDRFAFAGYNFVQMGKRLNERLRAETDPQAIIGFEGAGDLARSAKCDPELICREFGMWVPYVGSGDEFVRSVASREFVRGNWMGYHRDPQGHLGRFWRSILNGADSTWYWMWSSLAFEGFQRPDLGGSEPAMDEFVKETRVMRDGLGDLLLHYEMQHDGIAMLYSFPTRFVADRTERNKSYGAYWWTLMTWQNVVQDLNMQFNYVTERLLEAGELKSRGYKILILPQTLALGAKAGEAIREFVNAGGTVIADIRPGIYDAHGKPREKGLLDDLFGVGGDPMTGAAAAMTVTGRVGQVVVTLARPSAEHPSPVVVDPGVKALAGIALGTAGPTPVCLVHEVGKGRAVLLNFQVSSAFDSRGETPTLSGHTPFNVMPKEIGVFFQSLFKSAGVESPLKLAEYKKEGPYFGFVKVQRWRNGGNEIVAFLREADTQTRAASVSIRDKDRMPWLYDMIGKVSGGHFNFWIADLEPGKAAVFALLPGPLPKPVVECPREAVRGAVLSLTIRVPEAKGLHAFKLRACKPDGSAADFWERVVLADAKPVEVGLPVAFNDPLGNWTITLTDAFGPETEQTLKVRVN